MKQILTEFFALHFRDEEVILERIIGKESLKQIQFFNLDIISNQEIIGEIYYIKPEEIYYGIPNSKFSFKNSYRYQFVSFVLFKKEEKIYSITSPGLRKKIKIENSLCQYSSLFTSLNVPMNLYGRSQKSVMFGCFYFLEADWDEFPSNISPTDVFNLMKANI